MKPWHPVIVFRNFLIDYSLRLVTNALVLAFWEMEEEVEEDELSAISLVNYYTNYVMQQR